MTASWSRKYNSGKKLLLSTGVLDSSKILTPVAVTAVYQITRKRKPEGAGSHDVIAVLQVYKSEGNAFYQGKCFITIYKPILKIFAIPRYRKIETRRRKRKRMQLRKIQNLTIAAVNTGWFLTPTERKSSASRLFLSKENEDLLLPSILWRRSPSHNHTIANKGPTLWFQIGRHIPARGKRRPCT